MRNDHRKDERFENMGRVYASDLCDLSGILDDISVTGCRVHFPVPVTVDMDNDYNLQIRLSQWDSVSALNLIVHPQWTKIEGNVTNVGFSILRSRDTPELKRYIDTLKSASMEDDGIASLLVGQQVNFIQ